MISDSEEEVISHSGSALQDVENNDLLIKALGLAKVTPHSFSGSGEEEMTETL